MLLFYWRTAQPYSCLSQRFACCCFTGGRHNRIHVCPKGLHAAVLLADGTTVFMSVQKVCMLLFYWRTAQPYSCLSKRFACCCFTGGRHNRIHVCPKGLHAAVLLADGTTVFMSVPKVCMLLFYWRTAQPYSCLSQRFACCCFTGGRHNRIHVCPKGLHAAVLLADGTTVFMSVPKVCMLLFYWRTAQPYSCLSQRFACCCFTGGRHNRIHVCPKGLHAAVLLADGTTVFMSVPKVCMLLFYWRTAQPYSCLSQRFACCCFTGGRHNRIHVCPKGLHAAVLLADGTTVFMSVPKVCMLLFYSGTAQPYSCLSQRFACCCFTGGRHNRIHVCPKGLHAAVLLGDGTTVFMSVPKVCMLLFYWRTAQPYSCLSQRFACCCFTRGRHNRIHVCPKRLHAAVLLADGTTVFMSVPKVCMLLFYWRTAQPYSCLSQRFACCCFTRGRHNRIHVCPKGLHAAVLLADGTTVFMSVPKVCMLLFYWRTAQPYSCLSQRFACCCFTGGRHNRIHVCPKGLHAAVLLGDGTTVFMSVPKVCNVYNHLIPLPVFPDAFIYRCILWAHFRSPVSVISHLLWGEYDHLFAPTENPRVGQPPPLPPVPATMTPGTAGH